jgi:hypothetical protein
MSSSSTPDRDARSFARTQRFALASIEGTDVEETARIAFTQDASVLLGNDVPVVALPRRTTRLWLGTKRCYAVIEGRVRGHFDEDAADRWAALHPGYDLKWCLDPDVIVWSCVDRGPHAFLASEWLLAETQWIRREHDLVDHLNLFHAPVVEALVWEFAEQDGTAARVAAIDPEGLLIEASGKLHHIAFGDLCPTADDVDKAILRLLRNVACFSDGFGPSVGTPSVSQLILPGEGPRSEASRGEVRHRRHGCSDPAPPRRSQLALSE